MMVVRQARLHKQSLSLFRFTLSASAPAGNVNKKKGNGATVEMSEIKLGGNQRIYHIGCRVIVSRDAGTRNDARDPQSSEDRIAKCWPTRSHVRPGGFSLFDSHR